MNGKQIMRLPAKVIDAKANLLLKKISAGGIKKGAFEKIIPAMNGGGIEDFTFTSLRYRGTNPPCLCPKGRGIKPERDQNYKKTNGKIGQEIS